MIEPARVAAIGLFSGLTEGQLAELAGIAGTRRLAKGATAFDEGDPAEGFYAVDAGLVRIFKTNPAGKEQILHVFGPGEVLGEAAVFSGRRFPASAQALEDTVLVFFPRERFRALLKDDPDLGLNMLGLLSARLRQFAAKIEALSLKEVPARLAAHLLVLQAAAGRATFSLDLPKGMLASLIGTIPETLSRVMRKLTDQEIIRLEGASVTVLDEAALTALAEGTERL